MLLSTLVVYDSDFETKGKKIRVKDEIEPQHPQSNVCLLIRFYSKKGRAMRKRNIPTTNSEFSTTGVGTCRNKRK